ncbi:hypothetical protein Tco_0934033, partial [Tanacetum coccineum]
LQQQPQLPLLDSGLVVLVSQRGDDLIDAINHMMSFLTVVLISRYPTTNNQFRNSSNPRQQANITDGRVILQLVQGRQTTFVAGILRSYTPGTSGSNSGKQRTVVCYNYDLSIYMDVNIYIDTRLKTDMIKNLVLVDIASTQLNHSVYTGSPWVYLIHNCGTKHKVWLEKVFGSNIYALFSREWKAFITDSRYVRVNTLHFIRAAPDEYYVTSYHNDGCECNGYDLDHVGFLQMRFLLTVANLEESLCLGLRFERVPRMPLIGLAPFVVSPIDNDPRMRHECVWDNHEEFHDGEKDCFYSLIVAYVTDRNRLTIPGWFVDGNQMQAFHNAYLVYDEERFYVDLDWVFHADRPDRRNHMNVIAPWRVIPDQCHFDANKMVRFKLIESVRDPF